MTEASFNLLLIGIPVVVTQLANVFVNLRNGAKQDKAIQKQDVAIQKQDAVAEKVVEIHTATNGNLSALTKAHEVVLAENKGLLELVAELRASKEEIKAKQDVIDAAKVPTV